MWSVFRIGCYLWKSSLRMLKTRILEVLAGAFKVYARVIPRNPFSRATEKCEQSALKDAESTKGPASESRMGRVFMLGATNRADVCTGGRFNCSSGAS